MTDRSAAGLSIEVDGRPVDVHDGSASLLDVLRDQLGLHAAKDGCAPQGQCGCCTVLVDGAPRVACVTPVRRVRGRSITTPGALPDAATWAEAFCATGASQCGFCTPGIITRLSALRTRQPEAGHDEVEQALLAHLCRCTGWRSILDAWDAYGSATDADGRDLAAAARRASLEGGQPQRLDPEISLGEAGFADDTAPPAALVALLDPEGRWTLGDSVAAARRAAATVQGRRTTEEAGPPLAVPSPPEGERWASTLATSWTEPGYLETDTSWAEPGGPAADPLANGGAFGAKRTSEVPGAARHLAEREGQAVRARYRREDVVRRGPKRPPLAAGLRDDGSGVVRVARTPGIVQAIRSVLPAVEVEEVDVPGPPTSSDLRGAGWAEATALAWALRGPDDSGWIGPVTRPDDGGGGGGRAWARIVDEGIEVRVDAGDPLDEVALRSYCTGAAHQAASLVTSESLTVDQQGEVHDLTIRSFGILRAVDTPPITVTIDPPPSSDAGRPRPVSDAVFAAVAAAVWLHQGLPGEWPTGIPLRRR